MMIDEISGLDPIPNADEGSRCTLRGRGREHGGIRREGELELHDRGLKRGRLLLLMLKNAVEVHGPQRGLPLSASRRD